MTPNLTSFPRRMCGLPARLWARLHEPHFLTAADLGELP